MTRVHLYGASNVWLSRRAALAAIRCRYEGPLEIGVACGPGRSYGSRAGNVLVRYPPLNSVHFPQVPQLAVLADAGNDIAYGQRPDVALRWMAERAASLHPAQIVLTGTPLDNLRDVPHWLFLAVRTLIYPASKATHGEILQALEDLRGGARQLASERGYTYLEPEPAWFGPDRIHLHSRHHDACWSHYLQRGPAPIERPSRLQVLQMRPAHCWVLGREWHGRGEYHDVLPNTRVLVR
jgi:hypothetical protein